MAAPLTVNEATRLVREVSGKAPAICAALSTTMRPLELLVRAWATVTVWDVTLWSMW
jgi:hypothetical protein